VESVEVEMVAEEIILPQHQALLTQAAAEVLLDHFQMLALEVLEL
jgi:hypothetical protein